MIQSGDSLTFIPYLLDLFSMNKFLDHLLSAIKLTASATLRWRFDGWEYTQGVSKPAPGTTDFLIGPQKRPHQ